MTRRIVCRPAALSVVVAALLCACSGGEPSATVESTSPSEPATDTLARQLDMMAEMYGLDSPPEVDIVREIRPDELPVVQAECMTDQGFPPDKDGSFSAPTAQADMMHLALYRCTAMYPVAEEYRQPMSRDQQVALHTYYVDSLVPCLREQGVVVEEAPTVGTFLETVGTAEEYTPFPAQGTADEMKALQAACPQMPPR